MFQRKRRNDFMKARLHDAIAQIIAVFFQLRVAECKHRELGDKSEKLDFLTFCQEKPWSFRELISMRPV